MNKPKRVEDELDKKFRGFKIYAFLTMTFFFLIVYIIRENLPLFYLDIVYSLGFTFSVFAAYHVIAILVLIEHEHKDEQEGYWTIE